MSDLQTLRENIANYLTRSDLNTEIDLAINRAIKYYYRRFRFWFNETTASFSTVASQYIYTSADTGITDMLKRDYVNLAVNSTDNQELTPRTLDWVLRRNVSGVTGTPTDYAFFEESFYLYTPPDQVYTVTVSYVKSYADLVNDTDSNDFTNNAEDLIEARAMWWIYSRILKSKEFADEAKIDELDAFSALDKETKRLTGSGRVVPTKF